ncbi:MAG: Ig-like domain-containing protein, partial [Candidatus Pacebacteria bacterium]|nr:Ig-like domain-containing protein [Candidatus Paceibacterota bacterium]
LSPTRLVNIDLVGTDSTTTGKTYPIRSAVANDGSTVNFTVSSAWVVGQYKVRITAASDPTLVGTNEFPITVSKSAVTPVLTSISVTPTNATLALSGTQQFTAVGKDQNGTPLAVPPTFTWSTSAGSITSGGLLTAPGTSGTVSVTVTSGSVTGTVIATVSGSVVPTAPTLTSLSPTSGIGGTTVVITGSNFKVGTNHIVHFGGSNLTVMPTDATHLSFTVPTGPSAGAYDVSVEYLGSGIRSNTLTNGFTITTPGSLSCSISASPANPNSGDEVTWTLTINGGVAPFTSNWSMPTNDLIQNQTTVKQTYTANYAGTVKQTVVSVFDANHPNGVSCLQTVTVTPVVNLASIKTITVTPATATIAVGATQQFSAVAKDQNGTPLAPQPTFLWGSNISANISGAGTGLIGFTPQAQATGSGIVRATAGSVSGAANVTITTPTLASISVTPATQTLAVGGTQQFSATALDQNSTALAVQPTFSWGASVGSITGGGLFTAPSTSGAATVRAVSGSITGTAAVTVTPAVISGPCSSNPNGSLLVTAPTAGTTLKFSSTGNTLTWCTGAITGRYISAKLVGPDTDTSSHALFTTVANNGSHTFSVGANSLSFRGGNYSLILGTGTWDIKAPAVPVILSN